MTKSKRVTTSNGQEVAQIAMPLPVEPADPLDEPWRKECAAVITDWEKLPEQAKRQVASLLRNQLNSPTPPRLEVLFGDNGKATSKAPTGTDEVINLLRLHGTFASPSHDFVFGMADDLLAHFRASNPAGCSDRNINSALAFVHGAKPQDTVQAALATQMAATHDAAMQALRMLGRSDMVPHLETAGKLANKLLGTFARQAEVLAKLQRGGEQVVKHVHIDNRGGQAVVTEQVVTGGSDGKRAGQPYDQSAICTALLGEDTEGHGVPIASAEWEEAVSSPRRDVAGRAEG